MRTKTVIEGNMLCAVPGAVQGAVNCKAASSCSGPESWIWWFYLSGVPIITIFCKVKVISKPELSDSRRAGCQPKQEKAPESEPCKAIVAWNVVKRWQNFPLALSQGGRHSVLDLLLLFLPQLCRAILALCILGAIMRCFSSYLAIFRQLLLAAWTWDNIAI